jgi:hypothetical protein
MGIFCINATPVHRVMMAGPPLGQDQSQREAIPSFETHPMQYLRGRVGRIFTRELQIFAKFQQQDFAALNMSIRRQYAQPRLDLWLI